ncbi:eukaryotic translation initiation factor 3 subunit G [Achlya hypogyna]|uniref:Eukaryotic translation initiation factor 3 subunit G n=1 Tax=Achlya hypogyna TaxID=1202772 RepID=A0A1V9Z4Z3_ACHHY|nr:eukaryotic translation initiation factor 3 subunit G [Achlya hypogyna]
MVFGQQQRWGDDEIDDVLPPRTETVENGIKTVVSWKLDADNNKVKVTTKSKKVTSTTRVSKRVIERKSWAKFGEALEDNSNVTYTPPEAVYMEDPTADQVIPGEDKDAKSVLDNIGKASIVVCRHCGMVGDHWTLKCPYKDSPAPLEDMSDMPRDDEETPAPAAAAAPTRALSFAHAAGGKYVPPSMRGASSSAADDVRQPVQDKDSATLRVTNVSPETREDDLKELFRVFGPLERVYLAKDRETFQSRGFAFVSFVYREDAEKAMNKLQGYGYDHLILKLEWAKPSNKAPTDEGAQGTTFRSGYGKALPQNVAPPMRK